MTDERLVDALQRSRLGAELSAEQARTLAGSLAFRELRPDEVLVKEGTSDNHLYVIVKGALAAVRNAGAAEQVTFFTLTTDDLGPARRPPRDRLSGDACDHPHRPRDPAPDVDAVDGTHQLHLQAAREVLTRARHPLVLRAPTSWCPNHRGGVRTTVRLRIPCAPWMSTPSISAVADGPVMKTP